MKARFCQASFRIFYLQCANIRLPCRGRPKAAEGGQSQQTKTTLNQSEHEANARDRRQARETRTGEKQNQRFSVYYLLTEKTMEALLN